jgi:hypothetical protein
MPITNIGAFLLRLGKTVHFSTIDGGFMLPSSRITRLSLCSLAVAAVTSCDASRPVDPAVDHASLHATSLEPAAIRLESSLAQSVKAATARFNSLVQAEKAGYLPASPCISSPAGGMGYHYVNESIVDPVFDPLHPEALVYAPDENGKLRLAAVEYIVIDIGQDTPMFENRAFDPGGTPVEADHWSLHVWAFKTNPSGLFSPFNPTVVCPAPEI